MDVFTPPWRMDKNESGSGIALYIREDIPSRHIFEVSVTATGFEPTAS